jgi:GH15 family glucan-1,4-alpha-glucosidase
MIGDCQTAVLIGKGSVDWLCWPRFDSPACFAACLTLGTMAAGRSCPKVMPRSGIRYRQNTLILETHLVAAQSRATLLDFMPMAKSGSHLVRIVQGIDGEIRLRSELVARFEYGSLAPWIVTEQDCSQLAVCGADAIVLRGMVPLRRERRGIVSEFTVRAGLQVALALNYARSYRPRPVSKQTASGRILCFAP